MTRSSQTISAQTTALVLGSLVALAPALVCFSLIAVTGFLSNPWPSVLWLTGAAGLLGALTGGIVYRICSSLPLVGLIALLSPLAGLLFGPVISVSVQQFLAQWSDVHIYDSFGSLQLILPAGWSWGYTAITWVCIIVCCGAVTSLVVVPYMVWERYRRKRQSNRSILS
jgi:hypothetical protein